MTDGRTDEGVSSEGHHNIFYVIQLLPWESNSFGANNESTNETVDSKYKRYQNTSQLKMPPRSKCNPIGTRPDEI